jgi:hypothetical protein
MAGDLASLDDIGLVLEGAGYALERAELAGLRALLAESAYALVGCVELADWTDFSEHVTEVQSALGRVAGESLSALGTDPTRGRDPMRGTDPMRDADSMRGRDLYLVLHVRSKATELADYAALQGAEADTRHTRTLVRVAVTPAELDRALRPLLPLRLGAVFDLAEPLRQLHDELLELGLEERVADIAVEAFCEEEAVRVP